MAPKTAFLITLYLQVAGPMWSGSLHEPEFIDKMLGGMNSTAFGTSSRIRGMLTLARNVR